MTRDQFRTALDGLGLSQSAFAREVERIGGERLPLRTVQRWATGEASVPPVVPALLTMMQQTAGAQS